MASLPSQMKKISHNASMVQEEHMDYLIKHDHKFADNYTQLTEHQKKLEWFETIINSMKKRMGELQKSGKDTAAKLALGSKSVHGSRDAEDE